MTLDTLRRSSAFSLSLVAGIALPLLSLASGLKDADQILRKSEDVRRISNLQADVRLETREPSGKSDVKEFSYQRKLAEDGERFRTFTRFKSPASIRGQSILFLERAGFESDVFLYLPTFKKVRRVESHSQSSSFMGSAFSYSDIATPLAKDFNNTLEREEPCPVDQGVCYRIISKPKSREVEERTSYESTTAWINAQTFMPVQWEFQQKGALRKRMQARRIENVEKGKFFPLELSIEDLQTKRSTTLVFSNLNVKAEIPDQVFTQQNMSKE